MITQSHPSSESTPVTGVAVALVGPPDPRTPVERAKFKSLKKERKHERLRFFLGWCEGCQFFGSGF